MAVYDKSKSGIGSFNCRQSARINVVKQDAIELSNVGEKNRVEVLIRMVEKR